MALSFLSDGFSMITFCTGFDHFEASRFKQFSGMEIVGSGDASMIAGRYGGNAWGFFNTGFGFVGYSLPLGLDEFIIHFDINCAENILGGTGIFFRLDLQPANVFGGEVDSQFVFATSIDRRLQIYSQSLTGRNLDPGMLVFQTAANFLTANTFFNIQIVSSAVAFEVWVDNVKLYDLAGNIGTIDWYCFHWENLGLTGVWFDNFVVIDPTLPGLQTRVPNLAVDHVNPSANYLVSLHVGGNQLFLPNWQCSDQSGSAGGFPDGDLQYVHGQDPEYDCYEFSDFAVPAVPIYAAALTTYFRDTAGGAAALVVPIFQSPSAGGPPAQSGAFGLSGDTYVFGKAVFNFNFDNAGAWNQALLNSMRFGMTCVTSGVDVRYSQIVLERVIRGVALSGNRAPIYEVKEGL